MDKITKEIGLPALLGQCTEECAELIQACSKMERNLRNENPTRKTDVEIKESLIEELADVSLLIGMICVELEISADTIHNIIDYKTERWINHLSEHKKQEE